MARLHQDLRFSLAELNRITGNGFDIALINEHRRSMYWNELADYLSDFLPVAD